MKTKYYEDADLLSLRISNTPYKYARQDGDVIVHYSDNKEPVLIEIVDAAKFLKNTTQMLSKRLQKEIFSEIPSSVTHRIR